MDEWEKVAPFECRLVWERREFDELADLHERGVLARVILDDLGTEVRTEGNTVFGLLNPRSFPPRMMICADLADPGEIALALCSARVLAAEETDRGVFFCLHGSDLKPEEWGLSKTVTYSLKASDYDPALYTGIRDEDEALATAARDLTAAALKWCIQK